MATLLRSQEQWKIKNYSLREWTISYFDGYGTVKKSLTWLATAMEFLDDRKFFYEKMWEINYNYILELDI